MSEKTHKAARRVKTGPVRLYAVMTDSGSGWGSRSGIVSAFDNLGQARDEMNDLRDEGEHWWIVRGTFTPDKSRTKRRKAEGR